MALQEENLASHLVAFCRFARESGLSAGVKDTVDVLAAAQAAGVGDREILKAAMRTVLCSSKDEWDQFEELFNAFWNQAEPGATPRAGRRQAEEQRLLRSAVSTLMDRSPDGGKTEDDGGQAVLGATAHERLKTTDFSSAAP